MTWISAKYQLSILTWLPLFREYTLIFNERIELSTNNDCIFKYVTDFQPYLKLQSLGYFENGHIMEQLETIDRIWINIEINVNVTLFVDWLQGVGAMNEEVSFQPQIFTFCWGTLLLLSTLMASERLVVRREVFDDPRVCLPEGKLYVKIFSNNSMFHMKWWVRPNCVCACFMLYLNGLIESNANLINDWPMLY